MKTRKKLFVLTTAIIAFILMAVSCEKEPLYEPLQIETKAVTEITKFSALSSGIITNPGTETIIAKGICYSVTNETPDLNSEHLEATSDDLEFSIPLENLDPNTKYYVRAYATNELETVYGQSVSFTTTEDPLQVVTGEITEITAFSALSNGLISNEGSETILAKGICYSATNHSPDLESNHLEATSDDLEFSIPLEDLNPNTKYYVRAYATNESETVYGQSVNFTTEYETITDVEGNEYRITQIGDQVWTIDNLQVTHFNDGTPIQNWTEDHYWNYEQNPPEEPAYCWYDNDYEQYGKIYGALYNFHAASDPRIAPEGWRVPTYEDAKELEAYLGGAAIAGGKMKLPGTEFWSAPNTGATNSSGFSAKGGGFRNNLGSAGGQSHMLKEVGIFWTQTLWGPGGMTLGVAYDTPYFYGDGINLVSGGQSIRLIKE
jgi:uncharacterized protein (TIGR02145 family)